MTNKLGRKLRVRLYLGLRPRYLSSVHLLTALYWSLLIPYLCPMPYAHVFMLRNSMSYMYSLYRLAGIVFSDAYSVLV